MLVIVISLMFLTTFIALSLAELATSNLSAASDNWNRLQAASAADAGVEYAAWYLSHNDGAWPPSGTNATYTLPNMSASGAGVTVTVSAATGQWNSSQNFTIYSVGTSGQQTVHDSAIVTPTGDNQNAWHNAIFAGVGQVSGTSINGHMAIAGPVHILGTGVLATYDVFSGSGTSGFFNNYYDAGGAPFVSTLPAEATTGTGLYTLHSKVRVKNGSISMSGNATIGTSTSSGNKGSMDGIWLSNGTVSAPSVYVDNGPPYPAYDLGNTVTFPDLAATWPGTGETRLAYINSLSQAVYSGNLSITNGGGNVSIGPVSGDSSGSYLSYNDATSTLTIHGVIRVTGSVSIGAHNTVIYVSGSGTILSGSNAHVNDGALSGGDDTTVDGNLETTGTYTSGGTGGFPNNVIAFVSTHNISLGPSAQANLQGAFFAEQEAIVGKQTNIDGTLVSNTFDFSNPPALFYVPALADHLPLGVPGSESIIAITGTQLETYQQW